MHESFKDQVQSYETQIERLEQELQQVNTASRNQLSELEDAHQQQAAQLQTELEEM